ncbi:lytic murein transglycosylase [uncultured Roseobacter sp.]|uniref:lytic murein transglycosylase n=1 Tax=uncultured Roseobacter sp. TaxID=114847 RepID=UPI0026131E60|nr:lytic murein transglycosylase [uncultured Roseobacter sp.]
MRLTTAALVALLTTGTAALACGGSFSGFVDGLRSEAEARGHSKDSTRRFFAGIRQSQSVLRADRAQGVFQKPFTDFARNLISEARRKKGEAKGREFDAVFDRIEQRYGINRGVLLAFWAFETDYGGFQGDFNTANALVTLAHDCRRPELFRPQVFAALELFEQGAFDPATTTGAWAGEIGMVQMLPRDILEHGTDADGDGRVSLKTSAPDALMSGAAMLNGFGWRADEPWLQEVTVPDTMDWSLSGITTTRSAADWQKMGVSARSGEMATGLQASLILPQGRKGPAFLAYPNFSVYFDWNQSFTYVLTAAYFATRIEGAPAFDPRSPEKGLSGDAMKELQRRLRDRGHDVGKIDGILGAGTRAAVRAEQGRLGLPADAWPTQALLSRL